MSFNRKFKAVVLTAFLASIPAAGSALAAGGAEKTNGTIVVAQSETPQASPTNMCLCGPTVFCGSGHVGGDPGQYFLNVTTLSDFIDANAIKQFESKGWATSKESGWTCSRLKR